MAEAAETKSPEHEDASGLFLIEMPHDGGINYLICQKMFTVDTAENAMDIPWHELAALFRGKTLRAIPMPGKFPRKGRGRFAEGGVSSEPGVSSGPDFATSIEVNLFKIGTKR